MIMIYNAACEHFGLQPKYKIEDFLPQPSVPQITIDKIGPDPASPTGSAEASHQTILHDVVQQVYTINRDDFNTREIAMVEPEKRGKFFDDLRKSYPVRREFQNTTVVLATESLATRLRCATPRQAEGTPLPTTCRGREDTERKLKNKLRGIGFKVKRQK
jgi:erythronate-4-phosphate dehydrogenase